MYLSQLTLNRHNRQVQSELTRPYELHRTLIKRAFSGTNANVPRGTDQKDDVLFRLELDPVPIVLVQSQSLPDWSGLEAWRDASGQPYLRQSARFKPIRLQLAAGQRLAFRLCASPTKRAGNSYKESDKIRVGDRIALYGEDEQLQWLARKFSGRTLPDGRVEDDGGLRLLRATTSREERHRQSIHDSRHDLSFLQVWFDGIVEVANPALAVATLQRGVGTAKGMGCGLLSLAPISAAATPAA